MLHEFVAYLKGNPGYDRIIVQIREKYQSLGHLGGTIRLDKISNDEREVLRSLFKKNYLQKSASFPVEKFISSFETTRYRGIDFETVLSCYFGEKLSWKKNLRSQYADEKSQYFRQIITVFNDSPAALWLEDILGNKNNAYALLNLKYNEDPEHLKRLLRQVCNGLNRSVAESEKVRLALFASQITKDPHAFDMNRDGGRLLLYALAAYYKLDYPKNADTLFNEAYEFYAAFSRQFYGNAVVEVTDQQRIPEITHFQIKKSDKIGTSIAGAVLLAIPVVGLLGKFAIQEKTRAYYREGLRHNKALLEDHLQVCVGMLAQELKKINSGLELEE